MSALALDIKKAGQKLKLNYTRSNKAIMVDLKLSITGEIGKNKNW